MDIEQLEKDFTAYILKRDYGDAMLPLLPMLRDAFMAGWYVGRYPRPLEWQSEPPR